MLSERLRNINPEAFNNDKCAHEILLNQVIIAFERIETLEKKMAELEWQLQERQCTEEIDINKVANRLHSSMLNTLDKTL